MTNNTARKLTARQLSKALAEIDLRMEAAQAAEAAHSVRYNATGEYDEAAWHAAADEIRALQAERRRVEMNLAPIEDWDWTARLAADNVD